MIRKIFLLLALFVPSLGWGAAVVVNAEAWDRSDFGTSVDVTLGFSPTLGNTIIVGILDQAGTNAVTAVADNNAAAFTQDFDANGADAISFWRLASAGSGVTTITITQGSAGTPNVIILEVSGLAASSVVDDTVAYASDGDGFVVSHDLGYTTDSTGELIFGLSRANSAGECLSASGTTVVTLDTSEIVCGHYKIDAGSGAGTLDWDYGAARSASATLISYRPDAGSSSVIPVLHHQLRNQ